MPKLEFFTVSQLLSGNMLPFLYNFHKNMGNNSCMYPRLSDKFIFRRNGELGWKNSTDTISQSMTTSI